MSTERVLAAAADGAPTAKDTAGQADAVIRSLLEHHLAAGYRLAAVILGSAAEAEDATQDALERAWRSRASLREAARFEAWFQRILVNACRDQLRRRRSLPIRLELSTRDEDRSGQGARLDPAAISAEHDALERALAQIGLEQRVVIAMRFFLDLEIDEIARRLGTRPGTVKSRLHRGLKVLRAAWELER